MVMPFGVRRFSRVAVVIGLGVAMGVVVWHFVRRSDAERFDAALAALMDGKPERAAAELDGMSSSPEFRDHRRLLEGGILLRSGRPYKAERCLAAVPQAGELRREVLLLLGECYYRQRRLVESENCFLHMVGDNDDDVDAHRWLASIYYDLGTVTAATEHLKHLVRLAPSDFRPHRFLGLICQNLKRYTQAANSYQEALRLNPPVAVRKELQLELVRLLVNQKHYDHAIASLDRAPELAGNLVALSIRAECACALGQKTEAKRMIAEVLRALPDDRDALLLSAMIAQDERDWDDAIDSLAKLLKSHPHDFEARYRLARAYAMKRDRENSEREMKLSEYSKSLKARASDLTEWANIEPASVAVREALAGVCDELGESELAMRWRRAALALQTQNRMGAEALPPAAVFSAAPVRIEQEVGAAER